VKNTEYTEEVDMDKVANDFKEYGIVILNETKVNTIKMALEALGLALTNHHHVWTDFENMIFNKSINILKLERKGK
jgi:hypothetical protein